MAEVAIYKPDEVIILLGGIYQIGGLVDGSFVSIERDEAYYSTNVSADGSVTRTHRESPVYTVRITLSSVASDNSVLSAWAFTDGMLYGAMLPMFIKDANGTSLFYAGQSWIESPPSQDYGLEVTERVWEIKCAQVSNMVGGNYSGGIANPSLSALGMLAGDAAGIF